jgi:hypothetical protein
MAIKENFLTASAPLPLASVPEELQPRALENIQQQRMAQLLMQQGMQGQPQGQMISGHYVKASPYQNLAAIANQALGMYAGYQADKGQLELAKAIRATENEGLADYLKGLQGKPAIPESSVQPMLAGQPMRDDETGALYPPIVTKGQPAVPPNLQMVHANAATDTRLPAWARQQAMTQAFAPPKEFELSEGQKRYKEMPDGTIKEIASGGEKLYSVDGNLVDAKGNRVFTAPKQFAPHANQLVSTDQGMVNYNPNTQTATPAMMNGKPIMPPMDAGAKTDLRDISKQQSIVAGALEAVKNTPTAFGYKRGASGAILGESLSNRMEKPAETEARSYVFNIVSKVIHDRAGASQTPSEIAKINRFLPNEFDNADAIQRKLRGFQTFLADEAKGVKTPFPAQAGTNPSPVANANRKVEKTGVVQDGPNKGKRAIQYSDGTIEYK